MSTIDGSRATRAQRWLELLALTTFAFGQPLLSLVGDNATFLVAHGLAEWGVIFYVLVVLLVPAAVAVVLDEALMLISGGGYHYFGTALRALLLALILSPPLNSVLDLGGWISLATFIVLTVAGYFLFTRVPAALAVARYAAVAPLVFALWFLFVSPASGLVGRPDDISVSGVRRSETSVVWMIFDQLPLTLLLQPDGTLDSSRFPNFAALAAESTWFPRATTVASATSLAVPAALTGRYVERGTLPVASSNPVNLFTILGGTHQINAQESVTQMCPDSLCKEDSRSAPPGSTVLVSDSLVVQLRLLLPDDLADLFLPEMNDRWVGFGDSAFSPIDLTVAGEATTREEVQERRMRGSDDTAQAAEFLGRLAVSSGPTVHYLHIEKPHEPLTLLPDGRSYSACSCYRVDEDGAWPEEPPMATQRLQRYLLQSQYVDAYLGDVLEAMDESGLDEEAILVVMSDHGASLLPGTLNRRIDVENVNDVLPIPLFVRLPGQAEGEIDERPVQLVDVLPTVLDALGIPDERFDLDGTSFLSDRPGTAPLIIEGDGPVAPPAPPNPGDSMLPSWLEDLFPEPANPYRWGPNQDLFGMSSREMLAGTSQLRAELWNVEEMTSIGDASDVAPAHLLGEMIGANHSIEIAVAVDGIIAGTGATFLRDHWQISVMVDPDTFDGLTSDIELFEVAPDGLYSIGTQ